MASNRRLTQRTDSTESNEPYEIIKDSTICDYCGKRVKYNENGYECKNCGRSVC